MKWLLIISGAIVSFLLNFLLIEHLVIPDPCYYHSHDTNIVFDLFYTFPAGEGGHPAPTTLNIIFTLLLGSITGYFIYKRSGMNSADKNPERTSV